MMASRVERLRLPEYADRIGASVRAADRALAAVAPDALDTTHFDAARFPAPAWAAERFAAISRDGSLAYTPYRGHPAVLEALAPRVSTLLGIPVDPERHLLLTPGTQAGLFCVLSALLDAGDELVLPDPDYLFSERIARFLDARVARVPLREHGADGAALEWDAFDAALARRPKAVLLSNPNNPTGAVYGPDAVARLRETLLDGEHMLVVDALYARLVYEPGRYEQIVAAPEVRDRCVTLIGPSKTESLTGYRLGVVVGPAHVIDAVEDAMSLMALRAPAFGQHLLAHWLEDDEAWLAERIRDLRALRDTTLARLGQLDWLGNLAPRPATAYVFPDVSATGVSDRDVAAALATRAGVLVSPGYQFGPGGFGHFRTCYARDEREWDGALDRIVDVLDELHRGGGR